MVRNGYTFYTGDYRIQTSRCFKTPSMALGGFGTSRKTATPYSMNISLDKEKVLTGFASSRWMPYGFVILCCLALESLLLGLGWTDLSIPYMYYYDFLYFSAVVKGVLEHGWYLNNPSLGAPGALAAYDYTGAPNIDFLIIKFIGLFTSDWAEVINLFYVVTFPLAAVSALAVFRHFKIPSPVAITGSLLFAFAPFHFLRLIHVTYTNYFLVPLLVLVLIWILNGKTLIVFRSDSGRWKINISSGPALGCIVIALLISASGVYNAFFSCFFLVLVGGMVYLNKRDTAGLFTSWILIGVICTGLLLQMAPSWIYKMEHGKNPIITRFAPTETESYALKIVQMVLPAQEHRVPSWAKLREWYDSTAPLSNENRYSSLGLAGSVGFLILLIRLFRRKDNDSQEDLEWSLARLNIGAVLLATVGGFSTLFAYLINPQIRAYNRISIFIEFFAIFVP